VTGKLMDQLWVCLKGTASVIAKIEARIRPSL